LYASTIDFIIKKQEICCITKIGSTGKEKFKKVYRTCNCEMKIFTFATPEKK
jgi:hypothetical protein